MTDNELFAFIKPIIDAGLTASSIDAQMIQSYQPTRQGVEPLISVFMEKISNHRYGWRGVTEVWNEDTEQFDHVETQNVETLFQVGCISRQSPTNVNQLTAADILDRVAAWLQTDASVKLFHDNDMGIQRVTDIRNPKFESDTDQFQASPSFDFTITHKQSTILTTPKVDKFEAGVFPV